jgi:membrane protease YdiL (CAAX protease family)
MKKIFIYLLFLSVVLLAPLILCQFMEFDLCRMASTNFYSYIASAAIHLGLFSIALFFLWKKNIAETIKGIGFPGDTKKTLIYTVVGLFVVFATLVIFDLVATVVGFNDQAKIVEKVSSLPWYIILFAIFLAPISEELFFRALLVPRIGIVFSSIAFGLVHVAYGSTVELVGAALIGVILGFIFKLSRSITPCLLIHVIYNLISVTIMRFLV